MVMDSYLEEVINGYG